MMLTKLLFLGGRSAHTTVVHSIRNIKISAVIMLKSLLSEYLGRCTSAMSNLVAQFFLQENLQALYLVSVDKISLKFGIKYDCQFLLLSIPSLRSIQKMSRSEK